MISSILDIAIRDLAKARSQLNALKGQAVRPDLREQWAETTLQLAQNLVPTNVVTARELLDDVRLAAMAHPGEPMLARRWADAASGMVPHLAVVDVDSACSLLDHYREIALSQPHEPKLREQWTAGMKTLISHLAILDPARARSLQRKLDSAAMSGDGPLRLLGGHG